ncbi:MAG: archease [Armatimonadetes bacterium]|nr:archease [Armatimonadota bacterium]
MMGFFEIRDHTADIQLVSGGASLEDAFEQAALGLFSFITETKRVQPKSQYPVSLEATDPEALLVAWLNHLLYLHDADRLLFSRFAVQEITSTSLQAILFGEEYDKTRHVMKDMVKAATWHQVKISQETKKGKPWVEAKIILDV